MRLITAVLLLSFKICSAANDDLQQQQNVCHEVADMVEEILAVRDDAVDAYLQTAPAPKGSKAPSNALKRTHASRPNVPQYYVDAVEAVKRETLCSMDTTTEAECDVELAIKETFQSAVSELETMLLLHNLVELPAAHQASRMKKGGPKGSKRNLKKKKSSSSSSSSSSASSSGSCKGTTDSTGGGATDTTGVTINGAQSDFESDTSGLPGGRHVRRVLRHGIAATPDLVNQLRGPAGDVANVANFYVKSLLDVSGCRLDDMEGLSL